MSKMTTPVCNKNCVCVDSDCEFFHLPVFKDRKIIKKIYDGLSGISKTEENAEKRKANCRFGQLCYNRECGFRHRVSVKDRERLIKEFNDFKLKDIKVEKDVKEVKVKSFNISHKNAFELLEGVEEVEKVEIKKSWADLVDDDFYMNY